MSALMMIDQAQRSASAAQSSCTANVLRRAHAKILSSIRQHAATKLTSELKTQLTIRAGEICKARLHLLAELKKIRIAVNGQSSSRTLSTSTSSSAFSMFDDDQDIGAKSSPIIVSTADGITADDLIRQIHTSVVSALTLADASCSITLSALLNGTIQQETFLLFEPVLGLPDDENSTTLQALSPSASAESSFQRQQQRFQLQILGEEVYLRDVILPMLTEEVLIGLLGEDHHSGDGGDVSTPLVTRDEEEGTKLASLKGLLKGISERLALRVALDDIRTNETKICKRPEVSASSALQVLGESGDEEKTAAAALTAQQRRLRWASPPGTLVGSPESLPYCIAVVYGTAVEASIHRHGLQDTLLAVLALAMGGPSTRPSAATDSAAGAWTRSEETTQHNVASQSSTTTTMPTLNSGMLQFLLQSVLEEAARKCRLSPQQGSEESDGIKPLMRKLRGLVEVDGRVSSSEE